MHNDHEIYRITDILIQPFDDVDEVNTQIFDSLNDDFI
jgi:hypothetical protein